MNIEASRDTSLLNKEFYENQVKPFLAEANNVFITEAFRTIERQKYLYSKGRTISGNIATWIDGVNDKSMHQKGVAIDIAFNDGVLYPFNHKKWQEVAKIANKYGLDWGYDLWSHTGFIDKPHFQDNSAPYVMPPNRTWQNIAIDWAIENGVSNGERPSELITRVETMEMFRKYNNKK